MIAAYLYGGPRDGDIVAVQDGTERIPMVQGYLPWEPENMCVREVFYVLDSTTVVECPCGGCGSYKATFRWGRGQ